MTAEMVAKAPGCNPLARIRTGASACDMSGLTSSDGPAATAERAVPAATSIVGIKIARRDAGIPVTPLSNAQLPRRGVLDSGTFPVFENP